MKKCNKCGGTWVSQSMKCIYCGSDNIREVNAKDFRKCIEDNGLTGTKF